MSLENTVHFVELVSNFRPIARRQRVPRGQPSQLLEAAYAKRLVAWVDELRRGLVGLSSLVTRSDRFDESRHGRRVRQLTEPVRRKIEIDRAHLEPEIMRTGRGVAASHRQVFDRQTKAALGVEIPTKDERVRDQIDQFVSKNLTRIRSIGDRLVGEVESIVIDAWDRGLSESEVAAEIEKRIGVAETYARFLARDQMGALYSQVARARSQEIGVRVFKWWTEADGRVRPSHAVKHGKVFPYEGSRAPSFLPGDEYGCRCWEEPVFDEIRAKLGKGRKRIV